MLRYSFIYAIVYATRCSQRKGDERGSVSHNTNAQRYSFSSRTRRHLAQHFLSLLSSNFIVRNRAMLSSVVRQIAHPAVIRTGEKLVIDSEWRSRYVRARRRHHDHGRRNDGFARTDEGQTYLVILGVTW
jgi:hypothetical protein